MHASLPLYCETSHPMVFGSFVIAEPVNFVTNVFILLSALAAVRLLLRRRSSTPGQWLLVVLLFMTAFGSFAWHGIRTPLTLALDSWSGLAFLITLVGVWAGALYGRWVGILAAVGFVLLAGGSFFAGFHVASLLGGGVVRRLVFVPFFLLVTLFAVVLIRATAARNADAARVGFYVLLCGLAAAVGRTADLFVCPWLPVGSHFIWHIFLSIAAYLAFVLLCALARPGGWARRGSS